MSLIEPDYGRLDDPEALAEADPGEMLRHVASAAAQVREAQLLATEAGIGQIAVGGRPRAVVVTGMGGSGIAGDVLAAVCGLGCPVPISTVRGYRLPGWVGAADLVIAVSRSGATEETLGVVGRGRAARHAGCCASAPAGPRSPRCALQAGALFVPVPPAGQPRAALWGTDRSPLMAARRARPGRRARASCWRRTAVAPGGDEPPVPPGQRVVRQPGQADRARHRRDDADDLGHLAADRRGGVPVRRQLHENAKYPAISGELPEASHNQVMAFDGPFAGPPRAGRRGRLLPRPGGRGGDHRLHLVVLRDTEEHPQVARRREVSVELADDRGVPVTELTAEGEHPLERLAGLIAHVDYASVYLALAHRRRPDPRLGDSGTQGEDLMSPVERL